MVELDGIEYEIKDAAQNADDMLGYINDYCSAHNIVNSKGEVIYIEKNRTNPLYMVLYGLGYLVQGIQTLIYSAACSLNIARASDRQLLDICDVVGMTRNAATKTTIQAQVFCKGPNDFSGVTPSNVGIHITTDMSVTLKSGSDDIVFHPAFEVHIGLDESAIIILVAEQGGSYAFTANSFKDFDSPLPYLQKIVSEAAVSGHAEETIPELRQRLLNRTKSYPITQRTSEAIQELDGVTFAKVEFNYNTISPKTIGTIVLPPRSALLLVQGYSDEIAEVYYRYMLAETCNVAGRSLKQAWKGRQGQSYDVYITPPVQRAVFIRIVTDDELAGQTENDIRLNICKLAIDMEIGESLSAGTIIKRLKETNPEVAVVNVVLQWKDALEEPDEQLWSYKVAPIADQLITFQRGAIFFVQSAV